MSARRSSRRSAKTTKDDLEDKVDKSPRKKKSEPDGVVEEYQPSQTEPKSPRRPKRKAEDEPRKETPSSKKAKKANSASEAAASQSISPPLTTIKNEIKDELIDEDDKTAVLEVKASLNDPLNGSNEPVDSHKENSKTVLTAAGLSAKIELGKGTQDKCGECAGCLNEPCRICTACKRNESESCIEKYCDVEEKGREARVAARDLYMKSMGFTINRDTGVISKVVKVTQSGQELDPICTVRSGASGGKRSFNDESDEDQENQQSPAKKERKTNYVYGGKTTAAKVRRCGECEGCMRDDCGECTPCLDKPRFGGKGTKKRACIERTCRVKAKERLKAKSGNAAAATGTGGHVTAAGETANVLEGEDGIFLVLSTE